MDISDFPIEQTALWRICQALVLELRAQDQHEYTDDVRDLHSRVRGALALRFKDEAGRATVSFALPKPKEDHGPS